VLTLRPYTPADFEALWKLDQRCFEPGIAYSQKELRFYLRDKTAVAVIAELESKLAGFAVGHIDPRGFAHVVTIDVEQAARRSGVGTGLMSALEEKFVAAGCGAVVLETAVDNAAAIRFYKKHGYTVLKTIPRYYMDVLDALLMGKKLKRETAGAATAEAK
jgi:ribosomal-protein-alanine N-acetyltransferase